MLKIKFRHKPRKLSKADTTVALGPEGRISKMRKLVTALIRHERIEGKAQHIEESRGYAERLIQMAVTRGDKDKEMMEIADYWLLEKDLIHKLFKVLVPRYDNQASSYTSYHRLPYIYPTGHNRSGMSLLELKRNPWPPVVFNPRDVSGSLLNVLLSEAKKDYRKEQLEEYSAKRELELMEQERRVASVDAAVSGGHAAGHDGDEGTNVDPLPETGLKNEHEDLSDNMDKLDLENEPSSDKKV